MPDTTATKTRKRRTPEQMIADLEKEIEKVKQRADTKALRADPSLKLTTQAMRVLHKALAEAKDPELVEVLTGASGAVAAYLEGKGLQVPQPGKKRRRGPQAA